MASVREIARVANVSASTVSRMLNGTVPVSDKTRALVLSAIESIESKGAQKTQPHVTVSILMLSPSTSNVQNHSVIYTILLSMVKELSEKGVGNTLIAWNDETDTAGQLLETQTNGFLILGGSEHQVEKLARFFIDRQIPYIFINREIKAFRISSVVIDNEESCRMSVEYLISLGHKRIAYLSGDEQYGHSKARLEGYLKAMKAAQLPVPQEYVLYGDYSETIGYRMGRTLFSLNPRPTAVCTSNDLLAIGCMRYFKEHGLNVPEDFSVIGFGDSSECMNTHPQLSTVFQPNEEFGRIAVDTLLQMIHSPSIVHQNIMLSTRLTLRGSTGPVKAV